MISPSMWESLSFSELSDFSKLVFVSLISHADDEGRGVAKAATVANMTFPNDENKRVADVKKALSEIGLKMSVQFYSVGGREYYVMTNWLDYQTINKPTKSKLPPPPTVGEGGGIHSNGEIPHDYGSTTVVLPHDYGTKKEVNIKESNNTHSAGAREEELTLFEKKFNSFCKKWDIAIDTCSPFMDDLDFVKLDKAFEESSRYLQDKEAAPWAHTLSGILKNHKSICAGKYKDRVDDKSASKRQKEQETHDILQNLFNHYQSEEKKNGDE